MRGINEKNLLATGEVTVDQVVRLLDLVRLAVPLDHLGAAGLAGALALGELVDMLFNRQLPLLARACGWLGTVTRGQ